MKIMSSSRSTPLVFVEKRRPRPGMSLRRGMPVTVSVSLVVMRPPRTMVWLLGTVTVVRSSRVAISGISPNPVIRVEPITLSLTSAIWRVISLSEFTSGMTSSFRTTSRYSMLVETPPPENWFEFVGIAILRPEEIVPIPLFFTKTDGRESTVKSSELESRFT